jgi:linoleoyl-CoA desaturase
MSSTIPQPALHFAPPGDFARDLRRGLRQLPAMPRHGDAAQWRRGAFCAAAALAFYGLLLSGHGGVPALLGATFCAFLLIVQLGHDASHNALSRYGWINRAVVFWVFAIMGVDGALWRDRHVRLHHQVVNLPGTGIDADSVSLLRLAPDKPWHWWYRLQPLYAPLIYALGHLAVAWVEDVAGFRAARADGRREFQGSAALARFAAGKAIHLTLFLLLPWLALRPSLAMLLLGYAAASALTAQLFVLLVVGTHVSDLATFPLPDAEGRVAADWATHQLATSVDWAPTSRLAAWVSGGANAHAAHHLFPGYSHCRLAALSALVAETAAAHGLPHRITSFRGMVLGHFRHLVALSRPGASPPGNSGRGN